MDRINLNSFSIETSEEVYRDIANQTIAIRRIIPYGEAMETIQWAINLLVDDRPFIATPIQKIVTDLALLRAFTNIEIEECDSSEKLYSMYDVVMSCNLLEVLDIVESKQKDFIIDGIKGAAENIVNYRNSAAGIIAGMAESSEAADTKLTEMLNALQDPNQFAEAKHFAQLYEKMTFVPEEDTSDTK